MRVTQQMLNLDGGIEGRLRKLRVQLAREAQCVRRPVHEVRIAKRNVARALRDLLANVLQHHFPRYRAEMALKDRHHRAMAAQMLTAARGFGEAYDLTAAVRQFQVRVVGKRRQTAAIWLDKPKLGGSFLARLVCAVQL